MTFQHVLSTDQFDREAVSSLFATAERIEAEHSRNNLRKRLRGHVLATLFYEPSTRTRLSFEAAMLRLGGSVVSTESASGLSAADLPTTIGVVSQLADCIALRHPETGAAKEAARCADIPIINAGDGSGEHPTQALLDLYTILKEKGRIDGLRIALVGDLLYSRTVHSLLRLLTLYEGIRISLISPPQLKLPETYRKLLSNSGVEFSELADWEASLPTIDALYVTRIQKERYPSPEAYEEVKDSFIVTREVLANLSESATILHPLPRVNEIDYSIDTDPRAAYFRQPKNGLFVRMAILCELLGTD